MDRALRSIALLHDFERGAVEQGFALFILHEHIHHPML